MGSPSSFCITTGGTGRSLCSDLRERISGQGGDAKYDGPRANKLCVVDYMLLIGSGACDVELAQGSNPLMRKKFAVDVKRQI